MCYEFDYKTFRNTILYQISIEFLEFCNNTFVQIKNNNKISISEIHKRQGIYYYNREIPMYLINIPLFVNNNNFHIIDSLYVDKKHKYIGIDSDYHSEDNYQWILQFAIRRDKKDTEEFVRSNYLYFLYSIENPIFSKVNRSHPIFEEKEDLISFLKRSPNEKHSTVIPKLFEEEIVFLIEPLNDSADSILNSEKYFSTINNFLNYNKLNYDECLKLIEAVERDKKNEFDNGLATGF